MDEQNPYAPPQASLTQPPPLGGVLASPWIRLGATLLDGLILGVIVIPLQYFAGEFNMSADVGHDLPALLNFMLWNFVRSIMWSILGFAIWVAINWHFLQKGQTIGKKVCNLQIRRKDGSPISAMRIITHRSLPVQLAAVVPFFGGILVLVDSLLIFRDQHNTLHDDIADSKVIRLGQP